MNGRLKVIIFYGGFKFVLGGVNSHANALKLGIQSMGHEATLVTLDDLPFLLKYLPHLLEKIVNFIFFPVGYIYKGTITKMLFKIFFARTDADYLIFEDIYISWNSTIRSVAIMHAVWSDNLQAFNVAPQQLRNLKEKEINTIHQIHHPVVTVSEQYLDFLINNHFNRELMSAIHVVTLGIDQTDFMVKKCKVKYAIVYTGALEARKNILFLLRVFKLLYEENSLYRLTIIGDGPERQKAEHFIDQFKLPVTLLGRIPHQQVIQELLTHELYVHTSIKESFSYALLEAKLAGLKTFAYSGLQVPIEFIDTKIDNFDINDWFDAIIGDQSAPKQFNSNRYTVTRMVEDTLEIGG